MLKKQIDKNFAIAVIVGLCSVVFFLVLLTCTDLGYKFSTIIPFSRHAPETPSMEEGIKKFASEEEFKAYLQEAELESYEGFEMISMGMGRGELMIQEDFIMPGEESVAKGVPSVAPERVSETTVQVMGIDEPDIVKTDGKEIYFSSGKGYYWRPFLERSIVPPPHFTGETKVIKAFPPADLEVESKIDKRGDLLLSGDILVVFSGDKIYGYNVSNPKSPEKKWTAELENKNYITGTRLYGDKLYLITATRINTHRPCPIRPLTVEGTSLEIRCVDIYHPVTNVPVDITYNVMILDPNSGKVENTVSFVGTSGSSVVYMSTNAIYVTYSYYESIIKFYSDFFKEKCKDIIPSRIIERLERLEGYDISSAAKFTEFSIILQEYYNSLDDDEKLKAENEIENRMSDYYNERKRELEKVGIVKIGLDGFKVEGTGSVPGRPLNQFSLDEYEDHLRIATTIGQRWGWLGGISGGESASDVYVLDKDLKIQGSVKNLGIGERIYSVRFIEDKGYVVTFKQVDPFYVLDLSNPKNPELKGELKIPGYSSYLHPITKDKILGIGKESSKVKISLFDVASPENPAEADKYILDEYWSDVLNTHHAFLLDKKHEIFFLPGGRGAYIFSYKNDELKLVKAISQTSVRRAIYINDYLYIIGDQEIVVLNELDWEKVNELEL